MILCCGEALIDMIPSDHEMAFKPLAGGAVFNTAIGIGRQGVDVGLLSGVSTDLFGTILENALEESGVNTSYLNRSSRPTTLAFVTLENGQASYAFYDENTAGRMMRPEDMPQLLSEDIKALFFGGISLAVEPCAEAYAGLLKKNKGGRLVMLDPNIRPAFINDEARYRARIAEMISHCDIIKISDEDLSWISAKDHPRGKQVADILSQGPEFVCLTLGSKGVEIYDKSGLCFATPAPKVTVVDTVGAGDAFNAGFLVSLKRLNALSRSELCKQSRTSLEGAVRFATAFASDTATRRGSDPAWNFIAP